MFAFYLMLILNCKYYIFIQVQDAQATMRLYTMYRKQWEKELKEKTKPRKKGKSQKKKRVIGKDKLDIKAKNVKAEEIIPSSLLERD